MVVKRRPGFDPLGPALEIRGAGPATRAFFEQGLAFDIGARFHSAEDFIAALSAAMDELRSGPTLTDPCADGRSTVDRTLPSFDPDATDVLRPPQRATGWRWWMLVAAVAAGLGVWWLAVGTGG